MEETQTVTRAGVGRVRGVVTAGFLWVGVLLWPVLFGGKVVDLDGFHEMALAREVVRTGHVPASDLWSYGETIFPVVHHEWGMGMILLGATAVIGLWGLVILMWALVLGTMAACVAVARRRGAPWGLVLAGIVVASLMGMEGFAAVRAQYVTVLCMAVLLWLLELDRAGKTWWVWIWAAVFLVWVNVHGGFLVGLGVLSLYAVERLLCEGRMPWRVVAVIVGTVLLSGATPYGYGILQTVIRTGVMDRPRIEEWAPLWSVPLQFWVFVASVLIAAWALWRVGWKGAEGIVLLAVTAILALLHARHSSIYAVAWLCYVPAWIGRTNVGIWVEEFWQRRGRVLRIAFVGLAIVMGFAAWRNGSGVEPVTPTKLGEVVVYPVGAVHWMKESGFHGNLMTPFEVGAYVSWEVGPPVGGVKVSVDSRYEVAYRVEWVEEVMRFYAGKEGWGATLEKYPTDAVLVRKDMKVASMMPEIGWRKVYEDDAYLIFQRNEHGK